MIDYEKLKEDLREKIDKHTKFREQVKIICGMDLEYCSGSIDAYISFLEILESD